MREQELRMRTRDVAGREVLIRRGEIELQAKEEVVRALLSRMSIALQDVITTPRKPPGELLCQSVVPLGTHQALLQTNL